jgi:hypothetical protein
MGTVEDEPQGYPGDALDRWAARARAWTCGDAPAELQMVGAHAGDAVRRDVYLYVIGGFKKHNPAAALMLIDRLRDGGCAG